MSLQPSKRFLFYCLFFLAGIAIADLFPVNAFSAIFSASVLTAIYYFSQKKRLKFFLLCLIFLLLGWWRMSVAQQIFEQQFIKPKIIASFTGEICREPTEKGDYTEYVICLKKDAKRVLVYQDNYQNFKFGDEVEFKCVPQILENARLKKMAADGYSAICQRPTLNKISENKKFSFRGLAINLRQKAGALLTKGAGEPAGGFAAATFLDYRAWMDQASEANFARTGTSHFISISGLHMGIILGILTVLFLKLGLKRQTAYGATLVIMSLYLFLIGAPAPAVRSVIMAIAMILGYFLGRSILSLNSLILACLIMVFINPWLLLNNLSFQLSFLSLAGILLLAAPVVELFKIDKKPKWQKYLLAGVLTSITAQLVTWPLTVNIFGQISLVAVVANLIIVPLGFPYLLAIIIGLILASFGLPAFIALAPVAFIGNGIIWLVNLMAKPSWAALAVGPVSLKIIIIYYIFLIVICAWLMLKRKKLP